MTDQPILRRPAELDELDRAILSELAVNARISNASLAERVVVAPSTAHARVRLLIESGVVTGFRTEVSPAALGLGIQAMVSVNIRVGARHSINQFLEDMKKRPEVLQAYFLGGSDDYFVHIAVPDADAVRSFVVDQLSANPVVASTRTSFVFEHYSAPLGRRER